MTSLPQAAIIGQDHRPHRLLYEHLPIPVVLEDGCAAIPAIHHLICPSGILHSGLASHYQRTHYVANTSKPLTDPFPMPPHAFPSRLGQKDFYHERIIVRIILNRLVALSAWGWPAGMRIISPPNTRCGWPEMMISASPSTTCTRASNGAVCSLKPWPSSNANRVTLPVGFLTISRLTTAPSW